MCSSLSLSSSHCWDGGLSLVSSAFCFLLMCIPLIYFLPQFRSYPLVVIPLLALCLKNAHIKMHTRTSAILYLVSCMRENMVFAFHSTQWIPISYTFTNVRILFFCSCIHFVHICTIRYLFVVFVSFVNHSYSLFFI